MSLARRAFLAGALALACEKKDPASAPTPSGWRELPFGPTPAYPEAQHAAVLIEGDGPVLVALHGRGEANRGLEAGARGWRDDYHLDRARERLKAPPLTSDDLLGFVTPSRLMALNQSLAKTPYRGLAVACPYTPALFDKSLAGAAGFAAFVVSTLLPKVRSELGDATGRAGIDGVSMGGRLALLVGLSHPQIFHAVGALQPAIGPGDIPSLVDLAKKAVAAGTRLRLVTSTGDYFREAVEAYAAALASAGVEHELLLTEGPHDYAWNRGPGAYEMLLWHDRILRGLSSE
jgi:iron(III)-salmochelin esterase